MNEFEQEPFNAAEFAENPEPRCPCLLLLDTSASMHGEPINQLNEGLLSFKDELMADSMAAKRVEVAVVSFGPVLVESEFTTPDFFTPPRLRANGATPMGEAISWGLDMVDARKSVYRSQGISYYRPWIFLITDGSPTDPWQDAASRVRTAERDRSLSFFAVGVQGADMAKLGKIATRTPLMLKGLQFHDLFSWLSNSMSSVSRSQPTDEISLVNPATPDGWAVV